MKQQIELGLALAIAGQVTVGLTPGDGQAERAVAALVAVGVMIRNAAADDPDGLVQRTLDLSERTYVTQTELGWRFGITPSEGA